MSQKLAGTGRPLAKVRWQDEQRLVLIWVTETYQLHTNDRAAVFNIIYQDHLATCGKPEGHNARTLSAQYHELRKPGLSAAQSGSWRRAYAMTKRNARAALEKQVIEAIITVTGKQPITKAPATVSTHGFPSRASSSAPSRVVSRAPSRAPSRPVATAVSTPPAVARIRAATYVAPVRTPTKRLFSSARLDDDEFPDSESSPARRRRLRSQPARSRQPVDRSETPGHDSLEEDDTHIRQSRPAPKERELIDVLIPSPGANDSQARTPRTLPTTPRTSSGTSRRRNYSRRRDLPKFPVIREHGPALQLTAEELEIFNGPAVPITNEDAFPPSPPLFFRYWDETSQGTNTERGFVAGRYCMNNMPIPAAPQPRDLCLADLYTHYSRDPIATPFISTSCFLLWILRLAIREMHCGKQAGKISVINPGQLTPRSYYYSKPCQKATLYKWPYKESQQRYSGSHEFLVWHRIPQAAVLHTFSVKDFVLQVGSDPTLDTILQLSTLALGRDYQTTIVAMMREAKKILTPQNVSAIAQIVRITGLDHRSPVGQISHITGDVLRGLGFVLDKLSEADWQLKSAMFARAMGEASDSPLTFEERENMQLAFLNGVAWSLGDWIYKHRITNMHLMWVRAKRIGLESPARILAKVHLQMLEKRQHRMFPSHRAQALLEDGVSDDEEQEALAIDVESLALQSDAQAQPALRMPDVLGDITVDEEEDDFESESEQILYE